MRFLGILYIFWLISTGWFLFCNKIKEATRWYVIFGFHMKLTWFRMKLLLTVVSVYFTEKVRYFWDVVYFLWSMSILRIFSWCNINLIRTKSFCLIGVFERRQLYGTPWLHQTKPQKPVIPYYETSRHYKNIYTWI